MSKDLIRSFLMLLGAIMVASLVSLGFPTAAQDPANQNSNPNVNSNPQKPNSPTRRRSGASKDAKPKTVEIPTTNAGEIVPSVATPAAQEPSKAVSQTPMVETPTALTEQTDLSGTYAGTFDCAEAGLTGDTTLTVTGNQFTTAGGKSGRIVAATTKGYTSVALQFGDSGTPGAAGTAGTAPMIISLRGRKNGERLTLTSVPGSRHQCSFTPAASTASTRPRKSRPSGVTVPTPTGVETSNPPDVSPAGTTPTAEPSTPKRTGRRATKSNNNSNMNMNEKLKKNDNTGAGEANSNSNVTPVPTPSPKN
jgi:hypothetical protein